MTSQQQLLAEEGDTTSFKYYDASEDQVYDLVETYTFVADELVGTLEEAYTFSFD